MCVGNFVTSGVRDRRSKASMAVNEILSLFLFLSLSLRFCDSVSEIASRPFEVLRKQRCYATVTLLLLNHTRTVLAIQFR